MTRGKDCKLVLLRINHRERCPVERSESLKTLSSVKYFVHHCSLDRLQFLTGSYDFKLESLFSPSVCFSPSAGAAAVVTDSSLVLLFFPP